MKMKMTGWTRAALAAGLGLGLSCGVAVGQTAGQDMKDAGHDTKTAGKDTGHAAADMGNATAQTTKTGYRKTKHVTKKAYHKTANADRTRLLTRPRTVRRPQLIVRRMRAMQWPGSRSSTKRLARRLRGLLNRVRLGL